MTRSGAAICQRRITRLLPRHPAAVAVSVGSAEGGGRSENRLRLTSVDRERAHDRAPAEHVDAVLLARTVAQTTLVNERGRTAAVQIEGLGGAKRAQRLG